MPKVTLKVNGETVEVESDPQRFTAAELNAVERHTGMTVLEWADKLTDTKVSSLAWTALAWVAVRRSGRMVRWDEFEESISLMDIISSVDGIMDPPEPDPEPPARPKEFVLPDPGPPPVRKPRSKTNATA